MHLDVVEVTPSQAEMILTDIAHADELDSDREAFFRALTHQNAWANLHDVRKAWDAFRDSGKTAMPREIIDYRDIITGAACR